MPLEILQYAKFYFISVAHWFLTHPFVYKFIIDLFFIIMQNLLQRQHPVSLRTVHLFQEEPEAWLVWIPLETPEIEKATSTDYNLAPKGSNKRAQLIIRPDLEKVAKLNREKLLKRFLTFRVNL